MSRIDLSNQEEVLKIKQEIDSYAILENSTIIVSNQIGKDDIDLIIDVFKNDKIQQQLNKINSIEIYLLKDGHNLIENVLNHFVNHSKILNLTLIARNQEGNSNLIIFCLAIISKLKENLLKLTVDLSKSGSQLEILQKAGESFQGLSELTHFSFNFSHNPIGKAKELGKFGKQLESQSKICKLIELHLDMSNMHMGHANVHSYTQFITQNAQTLQILDLNLDNCCIEKKGTESIKKMIQNITKIREVKLNLASNGLMDLYIKDMLRAYTLQNDQKVEFLSINLAGNYLSHELTEFIHSTFVHNSLSNLSQLHLNLSKNKINNKALEHLTKIIENSQNLKQLTLDVSYSREKIDKINCVQENLNRAKSVNEFKFNIRGNDFTHSAVQEFIKQIENIQNPHFSKFLLEIDDTLLQNTDSQFQIAKPDLVFLNSALY